jgi:predicted HAD superfamily Cof-like phosphohydrolase
MVKARQTVPTVPTIPDETVRRFRASLILEEALETIEALGFAIVLRDIENNREITYWPGVSTSKVFFSRVREPDLVEIADGCADLSVVTVGTLSACGIPDLKLLRMVDKNNLEKFGPGSTLREDGKLIKPPNHPKPPIKAYLESLPNVHPEQEPAVFSCDSEPSAESSQQSDDLWPPLLASQPKT